MYNLCSRNQVKELLEKYDLSPKKGYGQNFLINPAIPERIAEESYAAACSQNDGPKGVLEIGPGVGALTQYLVDVYDKVVAVEIDTGLIPLLTEVFEDCDNLTIVNTDFMKLNLPEFINEQFADILKDGGSVSIAANLPYYITSPVLMKILESFPYTGRIPISSITVMVQLEVARRLCAEAGSADYGAITASIALRGYAEKLFDVAPGNFLPVPKVSSAVVGIIPHDGIKEVYPSCPVAFEDSEKFASSVSDTIRMAFGMRRKTLTNSMGEKYSKADVTSALEKCGIRTDIRGEKLSIEQLAKITAVLKGMEG